MAQWLAKVAIALYHKAKRAPVSLLAGPIEGSKTHR